MPDEWIDKDTHHKIVKLTRKEGSNMSFYFHNNPFVDNKMVFYSTAPQKEEGKAAKQETYNLNEKDKQLYIVDLKTLKIEQLTHHSSAMNGEIVSAKTKEVYYQVKDSVFSVNVDIKKVELVYVFPADFKASITCVNADGTLLAGAKSSDEEKELFKKYPGKSSYFNIIYEAKLPAPYLRLTSKINSSINCIQTAPGSIMCNFLQLTLTY